MPTLAQIHTVLQRMTYPAKRDELIDQATRAGVSDEVITRLRTLPAHRYGSTDTVMDALRGLE